MKKRDLLTLRDFSREEILALLQDSILLKKLRNAGAKYLNLLSGKTVAMIFEKPSTRTRASF
ncbi:MAG: ornithine carbamoyltransferase, partial [Thermofilum sp.]